MEADRQPAGSLPANLPQVWIGPVATLKRARNHPVTTSGAFPVPQGLRLIATDLDGTIVPHGATVSERTITALASAQDAGIHVVYVTGRPPRSLMQVVARTGHRGLAIGANGSVLLDLGAGTTEVVHSISGAAVAQIADALRRAVPDVVLGLETVDGIVMEAGFDAARGVRSSEGLVPDHLPRPQEVPVEELVGEQPIIKMLAASPAVSADELLSIGQDQVGHLTSATHSSPGVALMELGPLGVTKATTLASVANGLGIGPDEVISFGDMPNDLAMLDWAGLGYAMSGGHPDAIATADHLAPPADQDGVAQVLEPYLDRIGATGDRVQVADS